MYPEVALHPIAGPDGTVAYPEGHPAWREGAHELPDVWPRGFVDEMVKAGYAGRPNGKAAKLLAEERRVLDGVPMTLVVTGMGHG